MSGSLTTTTREFDLSNCHELMQYSDPTDILRMLKYALIFCNVLTDVSSEEEKTREKDPSGMNERILREISRFSGAILVVWLCCGLCGIA